MGRKATRAPLTLRQKVTFAHVTIASLLFPMVVLVAVSGGLLLASVQGSYRTEAIAAPHDAAIDVTSPELEDAVKTLLRDADIEHSFKSLDIDQTAVEAGAEEAAAAEEEKADDGHDHDHADDSTETAEPDEAAEEGMPTITTLTTQPAHKTHYRITVSPDGDVAIEERTPNLQRRLIGLHRGEAETPFTYLQYGMAVGLLCVLALGLYMGLSHRLLRWPTAAAAAIGLVLFLILAMAT